MVKAALAARGWYRFKADPAILDWVGAALPVAQKVIADSDEDWRCGGTWFVGVDALPNAADGAVGGVALDGQAARAVREAFGPMAFHRAQLSAIAPGYPRPSADETEAAYGYRLRRDAAHVDGILPIGAQKRRMLREPHGYVLGVALNDADAGAAPLAVWDRSHKIMAQAFARALDGHAPADWADVDLTDAYQAARRAVFAACARIELPQKPGEAVLLDRHLLHGVAPWQDGAKAAPEGRIIAYFRPQLAQVRDWL
ncbi:MAG: hypothetical protein WA784_14390 [Albidovulum sp.]